MNSFHFSCTRSSLYFHGTSQSAIVLKKQAIAANMNIENGARLTVRINQIVLVDRELKENVIKKKIGDVQYPDQGLVPDRPESKHFSQVEHAQFDI